MANICNYEIIISGTKDNCYKFLDKMKSYDEPNHFWGMFEADIVTEKYNNTGSEFTMKISGSCAWSLETCCRASGYSNGIDLFAVNTRDLDIYMTASSREEGIGFEEAYIYNRGECIVDMCEDI